VVLSLEITRKGSKGERAVKTEEKALIPLFEEGTRRT